MRNSKDLVPIIEITDVHEIDSQLIDMETPVYYLNSLSDYLLLDLKMYLEHSPHTVKECERCKRLFLPKRKSDKYCRLPIRGNRRTCAQIMHISPNDEFVKIRNKARDCQHKQITYYLNTSLIYTHEFLFGLYENWSTECTQKFNEYKANSDIEGFRQWITDTKFTSNKLKEEWELYKKNTSVMT